ncbi:MAG: GH116 family glycosyl-hydrolase, partial [Abditibacteriales bacterium]|nr:GH116 family glycosyl-hydrolase [Abditibacteriales bacterium]
MDRRDFIKTAALAVMAAQVGESALASPHTQADDALKRWTQALWQRGERRTYRGEALRHIAFPLGGIGAGQVFLTGRGRLEQWQIVNNFNSRAHVPGAFFGVWAKTQDGRRLARLLQEGNLGDVPATTAVEFCGEYPFAWLRYLDGELPLDVSLEAFSPFIPLNTKDSALPAAIFRFTVRNRSHQPVDAALMASAPNLVGWDGYAPLSDGRHDDFMNNFNTILHERNATVLHMQTQAGIVHRLSAPRHLFTNDRNVAYLMRLCDNAKVHFGDPPPTPQAVSSAVFWLNDLPLQSSENFLRSMLDAVQAGASLIVASEGDLLEALTFDPAQQERGDIVFEDWESGSYANWTVTGDCFGAKPATGTLPHQQRVSGWRGTYFVNTYVNGDGTTGRATSRPFKIERKYVHLLVGGGSHRGATCVNLKIGNTIVATAHGDNTERLQPVRWDVSAHLGKTAVIEIVDTHTGGWGHILVDDIIFSDAPRSPFVDAALMQRFREAMPLTWTRRSNDFNRYAVQRDASILNGIAAQSIIARARQLEGLKLKPDARVLLQADDGTPLIIAGRYGKGSVIVCNGAPQNWLDNVDKKTIIGNLIAQASGVAYQPQTGWDDKSPLWGSMALAVVGQGTRDRGHEVSVLPQWDDLAQLWSDFAEDGGFNPLAAAEPSAPGRTWNGALSVPLSLKPNEEK